MMFNVKLALPKLNKLSIRILSSSVLASIGLASGLIPEVESSMRSPNLNVISSITVSLSNNAYAQEFTPEETKNYAKAGYEIELLRRELYQETKNLINEPPPNIVCDVRSTINSLQPEVREIADRFCSQTLEIVKQNNLTVERYNELKTYYDRQDSFYQQVQSILLQLQN